MFFTILCIGYTFLLATIIFTGYTLEPKLSGGYLKVRVLALLIVGLMYVWVIYFAPDYMRPENIMSIGNLAPLAAAMFLIFATSVHAVLLWVQKALISQSHIIYALVGPKGCKDCITILNNKNDSKVGGYNFEFNESLEKIKNIIHDHLKHP